MSSHLSRFKEKIHCVDLADSVMVKRWIVVERDEGFGVLVANCLERSEFPFESGFVSDGKRDLEVSGGCGLKGDEIDLPAIDSSNIYVAIAPLEFKEYDVFENVSDVAAPFSSHYGAETLVGDVVFTERFEIAAPLDVISCGVIQEKRFTKRVDVGVDRSAGDSCSVGFERAGDAVYGKGIANIVKHEPDEALQDSSVSQAEPGEYVFVDDRVEYRGKIVPARFVVSVKPRQEGESAKAHVVGKRFRLGKFRECRTVFREGERLHGDLHVSSGEECGKFAGKELGVGAGNIYIRVALHEKSIDKPFEFWHLLNFVKKDVYPAKRVIHLGSYECPCIGKSPKYADIWIFKVDAYDLTGIDTFGKQFIAKELQEGSFPATAYPSDNLDDVLVAPTGEPIGEIWPIYCTCHSKSPLVSGVFACIMPKLRLLVKGASRQPTFNYAA